MIVNFCAFDIDFTAAPWFLHIDREAFLVSFELLDRPELRGTGSLGGIAISQRSESRLRILVVAFQGENEEAVVLCVRDGCYFGGA